MIKDVEICKSTLSLGLIDLCSVRHPTVLMIYTGCLFIVTSHQDVIRDAALYLRNIITSICHMSAPCVSSHQVMSVEQYVPCLCLNHNTSHWRHHLMLLIPRILYRHCLYSAWLCRNKGELGVKDVAGQRETEIM